MEKVKHYLLKFKWILIAIIALILIISITTIAIKNKSINVKEDVKIDFSGYENHGQAEITDSSEEKIYSKLWVKALKQSKFKNKEVIDMLEKGNEDDIDPEGFTYEEQKQIEKAEKMVENVELNTYNDSDLSNGDKTTVKLAIKKGISDEYKLKVKEFKKEFKVEGLKKAKTVTAKDIFSDIEPKFDGLNNAGELHLVSKSDSEENDDLDSVNINSYSFTVPNNGELKNNDTIKLEIPEDFITQLESDGSKKFSGSKTYNIKVKGLSNIEDIKNIQDLNKDNETLINKENKSSKYNQKEVTFLDHYYKVGTESNWSFDSDSENKKSEKVSPTSTYEPKKYSLITTAKIVTHYKYSDDDTKYEYYGYSGYTLENNQFIKDDSTESLTNGDSQDSQEDLIKTLKGKDFVKYDVK